MAGRNARESFSVTLVHNGWCLQILWNMDLETKEAANFLIFTKEFG